MGKRHYRRRKFLINRKYQLGLVAALLISVAMYTFVLSMIIFYPLAMELYTALTFETQARVSQEILLLHKRLWPAVIVIAVIAVFHIIVYSNRTAGPVYRVEKSLRDFIKGKFYCIRLRKYDNFKELEEVTNALADELESRRSKDINFLNGLSGSLDEIKSALESSDNKGSLESIEGLRNKIDAHCRLIDYKG